jgi:hypothetical protein
MRTSSRPFTTPSAAGGWSRGRGHCLKIRHRLGFLKDDGDDFADLVDVGEDNDAEGWLPFREVQYRWRRNAEARLGYHLWMIKPIMGLDPLSAITSRRKARLMSAGCTRAGRRRMEGERGWPRVSGVEGRTRLPRNLVASCRTQPCARGAQH